MNPKMVIMTCLASIICCIAILGTGGNAAGNANAGGFQWGASGHGSGGNSAPPSQSAPSS